MKEITNQPKKKPNNIPEYTKLKTNKQQAKKHPNQKVNQQIDGLKPK